jgi:hypothetical protein
MFVLKKLFKGSCLDSNKEVLTEEQSIRTVHALTNQEFYQRINNYVGWTVISATYTIPDFLIQQDQTILVAHYDLKKTVGSIKFTPISEYFGDNIESMAGDTIRAVGTINSPQILDSKRFEAKDISNSYTKPLELKYYEFEYIAMTRFEEFKAFLAANFPNLKPFDPNRKYVKPVNIPQDLLEIVSFKKAN